MKIFQFIIGLVLGILILIIPVSQFQTSTIEPLQTLAVQLDGRKKPLDTVARETVTQIHGKTNYTTADGEKLDYLQTYLALWFNNRDWNEEPFILFSYRPLKSQLGLNPDQKYFSFSELMQSDLGSLIMATRAKQGEGLDLNRDEREALTIENRLALTIATVGDRNLPLVPHPTNLKGTWVSINDAGQYYDLAQVASQQKYYNSLKQAYRNNPYDESSLGASASKLQTELASVSPTVYPEIHTLAREVEFYSLHPFAKAWILYALAFIVMLIVTLFKSIDFYWGALGIFSTGLLIHGYGFLARMQIAGRPPVTNMYESVI